MTSAYASYFDVPPTTRHSNHEVFNFTTGNEKPVQFEMKQYPMIPPSSSRGDVRQSFSFPLLQYDSLIQGTPKECFSMNQRKGRCFRSLDFCSRKKRIRIPLHGHHFDVDSWKVCIWKDALMEKPVIVCCKVKKEPLVTPLISTTDETSEAKKLTSVNINKKEEDKSLSKLTYTLMKEANSRVKMMPEGDFFMSSCGKSVLPSSETLPYKSSSHDLIRRKRIVNGVSTSSLHHPWMTSIFYRGRFICGGSIISDRVIITAAHCVRHALVKKKKSESRTSSSYSLVTSKYEVMIASSKLGYGIMHNVSRVIAHDRYHVRSIYYDIALLITQKSMVFSENVRPLCMPLHEMTASSMTGLTATMIGFGTKFFGITSNQREMNIK